MLSKPAVTGSCRSLCLELPWIRENCGWLWFCFGVSFSNLVTLFSLVSSCTTIVSLSPPSLCSHLPSPCLFPSIIAPTSLFPPSFCPSYPSLSTGVSGRLCRVETKWSGVDPIMATSVARLTNYDVRPPRRVMNLPCHCPLSMSSFSIRLVLKQEGWIMCEY